jgi:hypothetical protein
MEILVKAAWGSDDPTKAAFPFLHANAFAETGHQPQIFLLGEAVSVRRNPVAAVIVPVGWPPLREILSHTHTLKIPIHRRGSPFGAKKSGAIWRFAGCPHRACLLPDRRVQDFPSRTPAR